MQGLGSVSSIVSPLCLPALSRDSDSGLLPSCWDLRQQGKCREKVECCSYENKLKFDLGGGEEGKAEL